jgi:light-regulated signal transduction histidine kinase (bacteriophytochrome)
LGPRRPGPAAALGVVRVGKLWDLTQPKPGPRRSLVQHRAPPWQAETRLDAVESRADALLACGRHQETLAELEALTAARADLRSHLLRTSGNQPEPRRQLIRTAAAAV